MLLLCIGQEAFLLTLYLNPTLKSSTPHAYFWLNNACYGAFYWTCLLLFTLKQLTNVLQLLEAVYYYAAKDLAALQQNQSKQQKNH